MTLAKRQYGDPLEVLLRAEAKTCKGCVNEKRVQAFGSVHVVCKLKARKHGQRCDQYEEKPV